MFRNSFALEGIFKGELLVFKDFLGNPLVIICLELEFSRVKTTAVHQDANDSSTKSDESNEQGMFNPLSYWFDSLRTYTSSHEDHRA